ncbi:hypothetical protein [Schumannella sp. 10F1B-5-1]|uniref:hypothetical protein n=1 Tax=Schumannella sp. 10F1B-5-1 TaxID=2590780 RepID=UPI001130FDCB|nr:hypothetical protein [Schumannella sp. 10F1B-5-1]TPW70059.1 hypothetical protein FJ658_13570 [Schumannella sp. 10F1B-5-1]
MLRAVLLALLAMAGALLAVALGGAPAHADDGAATPPPAGSQPSGTPSSGGLLGAVGGLLTAVTEPVGQTLGTVVNAVTPASPAPAPAPAAPAPATPVPAAPAPAAPVAPAPVEAAPTTPAMPAPTADLSALTTPVAGVVDGVPTLLESGLTGRLIGPVAGALDQTIAGLPVLGSPLSALLGCSPVASLTTPVTGLVDGVTADLGQVTRPVLSPVADVVRGVGSGLSTTPAAPALPGAGGTGALPAAEAAASAVAPGTTGAGALHLAARDAAHAAATTAAVQVAATPQPAGPGLPGGPASLPGGTATATASAGGATAAAAADLSTSAIPALADRGIRLTGDDALPSTPTFDTDSSPD